MVKSKVEAGGYVSESEVIREGLRMLDKFDAVVEWWLQDEVGSTIDYYRADSIRGTSLDGVFGRLTARMTADADQARRSCPNASGCCRRPRPASPPSTTASGPAYRRVRAPRDDRAPGRRNEVIVSNVLYGGRELPEESGG